MQNPNSNPFLHAPIGALFVRTALPMILVMVVNGLFSVVDAFFLGVYAGADALTAVTITFPISMLMIALTTMAGAGMASHVARALGAGERERAQSVFLSAHTLALGFWAVLAVLFALSAGGRSCLRQTTMRGWPNRAGASWRSPSLPRPSPSSSRCRAIRCVPRARRG